jgi:FMN phosphatase YigB (HAD superfamily)
MCDAAHFDCCLLTITCWVRNVYVPARYGSTVQGLVQTGRMTPELLQQFYSEVYQDIDLSGLSSCDAYSTSQHGDATGYRHRLAWIQMLRDLPCHKYIASNSPAYHVHRVLAALGLADINWDSILCATADCTNNDVKTSLTKADAAFYSSILQQHAGCDITLLDDSLVNLSVADKYGMHTIHVDNTKGSSTDIDQKAKQTLDISQALAW